MRARDLKIFEETRDDINIFRLNGQLDSTSSVEFEQKLLQAMSNGSKHMVLSFKDLHYISSAGIRVILKCIKAVKVMDGCITLCCLQDYVKEVFEISGMGALLPIFTTMDDALDAL
ncbi:MAG: STAS domain-containing protein [Desulfobacterales bacterium]|nr:STAS domain-containing protein [Desulfobacterales bacterium]